MSIISISKASIFVHYMYTCDRLYYIFYSTDYFFSQGFTLCVGWNWIVVSERVVQGNDVSTVDTVV